MFLAKALARFGKSRNLETADNVKKIKTKMSSEEKARNVSNDNIPSGQEALDLAHERPKMMPNAR